MSQAIQKMYTRIDRGYELVNHLFSLYMDRGWRRRAARMAASQGGSRWLDLCTGTGEMALDLERLAPPGTKVLAADFSLPMLRQALRKPGANKVGFALADAGELPFADETFDLVTISFATRNLESSKPLEVFFCEVRRVLRPGGVFVHLETSQPPSPPINALFRGYVRATIPLLGRLVTGVAGPYRFLAGSVVRFHGAEELAEILRRSGFAQVGLSPLLLGAVAIHRAVK
jgi:demethylmenaquinone methyltransferase/2-methoxy-6-polyprenyl-1,4-benzoquinol methylase